MSNESTIPTKIKSGRKVNFFILDNSLFDTGLAAKIGPTALALYAYLCRKANQDAECWPSQTTMAKAVGVSVRTVRTALDILQRDGLISRIGENGSVRTIEVHEPRQNLPTPPAENDRGPRQKTTGDPCPFLPGINTQEENTGKNTSTGPSSSSRTTETHQISTVFNTWKEVLNHPNARMDEKRRRAIRVALALGFTPEDLERAVKGCKASPFHMGENDRHQRYDDITLILRDAAHIERFMGYAECPPKRKAEDDVFATAR